MLLMNEQIMKLLELLNIQIGAEQSSFFMKRAGRPSTTKIADLFRRIMKNRFLIW